MLAIAEKGGGVFTLAVDAQNRGFFLEARAVVGTGGVGQVVLDRLDLDFFGSKPSCSRQNTILLR